MPEPAFFAGVGMAGTGDGKKEEADYKRLHSFPLIRVRHKWDGSSWKDDNTYRSVKFYAAVVQ